MANIIKTIYGRLLDWSGLANVPAALKALAGLKGSTGQIIEISGAGGDGTVSSLTAVDKPAGNGATVPTKVSAFENDAGYTTETRVQELLAEFPTFQIKVVQELPAAGEEKTIYLVPFADDSGSYLEYLYVNGAWEVVGSGKDSGENANNVFAGLTALFFGDSLTEQNYHYTKGYHQWVKELLGLASYNNYGKSGYKVSDVYSKVNSVTDTADIVFVMCGINDQNFSVPLGAMGDNTTGTTYGALNLLCALLKQKYPTSIVVFITPHYQTKYPHSAGITSYEVAKAIREVCEKYAIPVYDNYAFSGIYSTNLSVFTTDNCHWNDTAHEMVGKNLARFMTDSFRYVYDGEIDNGGEEEPEAILTSISATYSGGDVTAGTAVTALTGIVVTAHYSDGTSETVTGYTLSGTIAEGNNVVTVSYGGKTTTITVVGITEEEPEYPAKTFELTGAKKEGEWHISLYATAEDLPSIDNKTVTWGFTIEPLSEFEVKPGTTGGIFIVNELYDLLSGYTNITLGKAATVTDNGNGTYAVSMTHTVNKVADKAYWMFPTLLKVAIGEKFTISDAYINVGELSYPICAIGGAFAEETATITDAE